MVAITGHTSGIGKYIFANGFNSEVHGFSRANGYDISKIEDINLLVEMMIDDNDEYSYNIFINNAFSNDNYFAQTEILYKIAELWAYDETKTIINISSINADLTEPKDFIRSKYAIAKKSQDEAIKHLRKLCKCKIINIKPGVVDTEYNKNKNIKKLSTAEIACIIEYAINNNILDITISK